MLAATQHSHNNALLVLAAIVGGMVVYILPALIASRRRHPQANTICILNLFLGWSFIGWVIALAWSFSAINKGPAA